MTNPPAPGHRAVLYALLAYGIWGLFPIYWKCFGKIPPLEIISHRLVWSLFFLALFAAFRGQLRACAAVALNPRLLGVLFVTASLLSLNWGVFIYAVTSDHVVEASLGYFINPLVNVLLGFLVLRERLTRPQLLAVLLAAAGVVYFGWHLWKIPWIALAVALSFGAYGLLRKMVPVDPLTGLVIETAIMTPFAAGLIGVLAARGSMHFADSPALVLLFIGGGAVTAFPLLWFITAARLLPLSTLGFFQYLAPTLQLLSGVLLYGEPFTHRDAIAFALIWTAIAIFLASARPPAASENRMPA